jgi:hypothetical protein
MVRMLTRLCGTFCNTFNKVHFTTGPPLLVGACDERPSATSNHKSQETKAHQSPVSQETKAHQSPVSQLQTPDHDLIGSCCHITLGQIEMKAVTYSCNNSHIDATDSPTTTCTRKKPITTCHLLTTVSLF